MKKYQCDRTKTTHILTGAFAKQVTRKKDLKKELLLPRWYGLATDVTNDDDNKFLSLLVTYVDKDSGLITT